LVETHKAELRCLSALNVKTVRMFAGWTPAEELTERRWKNAMEALKELDRFALGLDMQIAIETHGTLQDFGAGRIHFTNLTTRFDLLERLLEEMPARMGILFDPANLRVAGDRSLPDYVKLLNGRITALHLKDWVRNADDSWAAVAIGDADYDWAPVFNALQFDGVALIEYENCSDLAEGMRRSIAYMERIF
jgi:sugar phosphate isomerase/epimerase